MIIETGTAAVNRDALPVAEQARAGETMGKNGTVTRDDGVVTVNLADCDRDSVLLAVEKAKAARREGRGKTQATPSPLEGVGTQGYERIRQMAGRAYRNVAMDMADESRTTPQLYTNA